jgi:hypothetical protein
MGKFESSPPGHLISDGTFLCLKRLALYSSRSVRSLRQSLTDRGRPLPHYKIGGKIFVRRSDYDAWAERFRVQSKPVVTDLVDDVLKGL